MMLMPRHPYSAVRNFVFSGSFFKILSMYSISRYCRMHCIFVSLVLWGMEFMSRINGFDMSASYGWFAF